MNFLKNYHIKKFLSNEEYFEKFFSNNQKIFDERFLFLMNFIDISEFL